MQFTYNTVSTIEPGTYVAQLTALNAYTGTRYQSEDIEPMLQFLWEVQTSDGYMRITDLVRLPLARNTGLPFIADQSKLLNRVASLYGRPVTAEEVADLGLTIDLPDPYNDPATLLALPHWSDRKADGFAPIAVKAFSLDGVSLLGRYLQVSVIAHKSGAMVVETTLPLPRGSGVINPNPF